jgi:hypothetical protein
VVHSLNKGKAGEREWSAYLNFSLGCNARRSQQYAGGHDSADIFDSAMPDLHWECKRTERLNLDQAMAQAIGDADKKVALVAHRKNRGKWLVTLQASDIKRFVTIVSEHLQSKV